SVAEQQLALVAGAQHQALEGGALIVQNRHPLTGALISQAQAVSLRKLCKVSVDLRSDRHVERLDAKLIDDRLRIVARGVTRGLIRHRDRQDILRSERSSREKYDHAGINTAR